MKQCGQAEMFSDHRRVVQAFNKGEVNFIRASHKDADLWVQVCRKIGEFVDEDIDLCVVKNSYEGVCGNTSRGHI